MKEYAHDDTNSRRNGTHLRKFGTPKNNNAGNITSCSTNDSALLERTVAFCNPNMIQPSPDVIKFEAVDGVFAESAKENHHDDHMFSRFDALNLSSDSSESSDSNLLNPYSPRKVKAVAAAQRRKLEGFVQWNDQVSQISFTTKNRNKGASQSKVKSSERQQGQISSFVREDSPSNRPPLPLPR